MIRLVGLIGTNKNKLTEDEMQFQPFDFKYYQGQIDSITETLETMEEELIRDLEGRAEDDVNPSYAAEQALGQARRYFNGAEKQIEGLQKLLDRLDRTGELENY